MYQPGWIIYVHEALSNLQHEASFFLPYFLPCSLPSQEFNLYQAPSIVSHGRGVNLKVVSWWKHLPVSWVRSAVRLTTEAES